MLSAPLPNEEREALQELEDYVAVLVLDEPAAIRRDGVGDKHGIRRTRPAERQQLAVVRRLPLHGLYLLSCLVPFCHC